MEVFMKIIKQGRKIPRTMQVTCDVCDAELEIDKNDLNEVEFEGQINSTFYYTYTCPCCSEKNSINLENLAEGIRMQFGK